MPRDRSPLADLLLWWLASVLRYRSPFLRPTYGCFFRLSILSITTRNPGINARPREPAIAVSDTLVDILCLAATCISLLATLMKLLVRRPEWGGQQFQDLLHGESGEVEYLPRAPLRW